MTEDAKDGVIRLLQARGLSRSFGKQLAVNNLSLDLQPGEIVGFLGPNGAGKSTTLRMITGCLEPDAGSVEFAGHKLFAGSNFSEELAARNCFGYLPESLPLYPEMQVKEYLEFIADSRELTGDFRKKRLRSVVEQLQLGAVLRRPTVALSKGFRQRVGLAQAMLHDPQVLILDEPTNGLDPVQITEFRSLLQELSQNKAIVFSTHILQEVAAVCTRLIVIKNGCQVAAGSPADLKQQLRGRQYRLQVQGSWPEKPVSLAGLGKFQKLEKSDHSSTLYYALETEGPDLAPIGQQISQLNCTLVEAAVFEPSLEQVYMQLMEKRAIS